MIARFPKRSLLFARQPKGRSRWKFFVIRDRLGRLKEEDNAYPRGNGKQTSFCDTPSHERRLIMNTRRLGSPLPNEMMRRFGYEWRQQPQDSLSQLDARPTRRVFTCESPRRKSVVGMRSVFVTITCYLIRERLIAMLPHTHIDDPLKIHSAGSYVDNECWEEYVATTCQRRQRTVTWLIVKSPFKKIADLFFVSQ